MEPVAKNIAQLRRKCGKTQQQLGEELGVSCQTVSKWECGVTLPDLSLIPALCTSLGVSADQLLGLVPLPDGFIPADTGESDFWAHRAQELRRSRRRMWNDDYLGFLVEKVWKLTEPVRVLDCGCGAGALGLALLPHLPAGSSYTGVDHAATLLAEARTLFAQQNLPAEFIEADLYRWQPQQQYDVVLCQTVLRHVNDAPALVRRMAAFARPGGLVAGIEVNRAIEAAGLYVEGMDYADVCRAGDFTPLWRAEYARQGRDWAVGMRLPHLLYAAGLKQVDARFNDRVTCLLPGDAQHAQVLEDLMLVHRWGRIPTAARREEQISYLTAHGMTRAEAEERCVLLADIALHLKDAGPDAALTHLTGLLIAWGYK